MSRPFSDEVLVKELIETERWCRTLVALYESRLAFPTNHRQRLAPLTRDDRKTIYELSKFAVDVVGEIRVAVKAAAERKDV